MPPNLSRVWTPLKIMGASPETQSAHCQKILKLDLPRADIIAFSLFVNYETAMLSSLERSFFFNVHNMMMNHHWWLIKYLHIFCYISFKSSSSCGFCVITAKANCGVFSNSSIWLLVSIYLLVLPVKLLHPLPPRLLMQLELRQTFPHAFTPETSGLHKHCWNCINHFMILPKRMISKENIS